MIATPPPVQAEVISVSALLFMPHEGKQPFARPSGPFQAVYADTRGYAWLCTDRVRVTTVRCRPQGTVSQGMCPTPLVQEYFPESVPNTIILTQGLNGEPLRFPLHIWYCPTALQRGAPVNRAIYRITSGTAPKPWCGPVVVLKFNGSRRQGYSDAGTNDLPALSAYFLAYN